jgi:hypothetical protein
VAPPQGPLVAGGVMDRHSGLQQVDQLEKLAGRGPEKRRFVEIRRGSGNPLLSGRWDRSQEQDGVKENQDGESVTSRVFHRSSSRAARKRGRIAIVSYQIFFDSVFSAGERIALSGQSRRLPDSILILYLSCLS